MKELKYCAGGFKSAARALAGHCARLPAWSRLNSGNLQYCGTVGGSAVCAGVGPTRER